MKKILTIAGSDSSGGAGIQADIKTITAHRMYAMSAITALTAQNTTGVYGVIDVEPEFVAKQLDCVFEDIRPDAVKIGMVSSAGIIDAIADRLEFYKAERIVADPVMISTSGCRLISEDAQEALVRRLLPIADVITPNLYEAQVLCGGEIDREDDILTAGRALSKKLGTAVLIKGGHLSCVADDLLVSGGEAVWLRGQRYDNPNTHGTGCTLSSAFACALADGLSLPDAARRAKEYVAGAIRDGLNLGKGRGPLNHMYNLK